MICTIVYSKFNIWLESSPPSLAGLVILGEAGANPLIPKVFEAACKRQKMKYNEKQLTRT